MRTDRIGEVLAGSFWVAGLILCLSLVVGGLTNLHAQGVTGSNAVGYEQEGNSSRASCFVEAVSATTQCFAAAPTGSRWVITSAYFSNEAATVQSVDIVFGTGSNCGTNTTAMTHKFQMGTVATTTSPFQSGGPFITPLVPAGTNSLATAICIRPSQATNFGATLTGYLTPAQ